MNEARRRPLRFITSAFLYGFLRALRLFAAECQRRLTHLRPRSARFRPSPAERLQRRACPPTTLISPCCPAKRSACLGGGQLGRMFGIEARKMGYRVHALDPAMDCPAGQVADVEINRKYDDLDAARNFANRVDVVTFEFENVPAETLEAIEGITPVHPRAEVLHTCRNRLREKTFLQNAGFPVADFRAWPRPGRRRARVRRDRRQRGWGDPQKCRVGLRRQGTGPPDPRRRGRRRLGKKWARAWACWRRSCRSTSS